MPEVREPPPRRAEKGGEARRRLRVLVSGVRIILVPLCVFALCLAVGGGLAFVIYPYVQNIAWFRNVAAGVTLATVVGFFARFSTAVVVGGQNAVAHIQRGWKQIRLAVRKESSGPAVPPTAAAGSGLVAAACALVASLFSLLVVGFAVAFNLVHASPELSGPVPVQGFRLGGSPAFRSTIFFPKEAKFQDWIADCSLDAPYFDAYENGVLELLRPFDRCVRDSGERLQLRLRGFASSSGFAWPPALSKLDQCDAWKSCVERERCGPPDGSSGYRKCIERAFNLCVAEERARQARDWMQALDPIAEGFEIEAVRWKSHRKMAAKQIVDRENGKYDGTTGALNRRVELTVVDAGACQVVTREPVVSELPGHELASSFLAGAMRTHIRLKTRAEAFQRFFRRPGPDRARPGGERDPDRVEGSWRMSDVGVESTVVVGLLGVMVTVYLALDKRIRRVERRSRKLRHRVDALEGHQDQVILKQRGLSRNTTIALSIGCALAAILALLFL